jgi:hypothetical protein
MPGQNDPMMGLKKPYNFRPNPSAMLGVRGPYDWAVKTNSDGTPKYEFSADEEKAMRQERSASPPDDDRSD